MELSLQEYAPGLDVYLVAISFVLTYAIKTIFKDQLQTKAWSRVTPLLPIIAGILGSFVFMATGDESSASQPASMPVVLAVVSWKHHLGSGMLNGFYSMGVYQILKRAAMGKELPGVPAGKGTAQAAAAILAEISPGEVIPTPTDPAPAPVVAPEAPKSETEAAKPKDT